MNLMRKAGVALITAMLGVGALGIMAPAHAYDTQWPCGGCLKPGPQH